MNAGTRKRPSKSRRGVGASGGRQTLLTPDRHKAIVQAVADGQSVAEAARLSGIVPRTAQGWLHRGRVRSAEPYSSFAVAVREAEEVAAEAAAAAGFPAVWPMPQTPAELNDWLEETTGYRLPAKAVCPGHDAPLDFVWDVFSGAVTEAIVLASRGGGKTLDVALLHLANAALKPAHSTIHYGATADQSTRAYTHYLQGVRGEALREHAPKSLQSRTEWLNRSRTEIHAATAARTQGGHPQVVSFDELDSLQSRQAFENSRGMPIEYRDEAGRTVPGQYVITSTRVLRAGPMQQAIDDAPKTGARIYSWCVFETMRPCEIPEDSPLAQDAPRLDLTAADGWRSIEDVTMTHRRMAEDTWSAQMLNRRPQAGALIYSNFSEANITEDAEYIEGRGPLLWGYDWGFNDDTWIGFFQLREGAFHLFDEVTGNHQSEVHWIREGLRRVCELSGYDGPTFEEWIEIWNAKPPRSWPKPWPQVFPHATGDPSAGHFHRELKEFGIGRSSPKRVKHQLEEGQNVLRAAIHDGRRIRLFVHPRCRAVISGFQHLQARVLPDGSFDERPDPAPSNHKFSHGPDGARYLVYANRRLLGLGRSGAVEEVDDD
jgi:transposase